MAVVNLVALVTVAADILYDVCFFVDSAALADVKRVRLIGPCAHIFFHFRPQPGVEFIVLWLHVGDVERLIIAFCSP